MCGVVTTSLAALFHVVVQTLSRSRKYTLSHFELSASQKIPVTANYHASFPDLHNFQATASPLYIVTIVQASDLL
jgi:hypothetical protein